jgi:hypothetical protein
MRAEPRLGSLTLVERRRSTSFRKLATKRRCLWSLTLSATGEATRAGSCADYLKRLDMNQFGRRLVVLSGVALMVVAFEWTYCMLSSPLFEYMGWTYEAPDLTERAVFWSACLLPAFWLPLEIHRPSQILYWVSYVFVYIPSIEIGHFLRRLEWHDRVQLTVLLVIGFGISGLCYIVPVGWVRNQRWTERQFLRVIVICYAIGMALNIASYWGHMRLVAFEDRTEHRLAMREVNTNIVADYAMAHLAWFINPFFMVLALKKKQVIWLVLAAAGVIVLYAASASRAFALTLLYVPALYLLTRITRHLGLWLPWCVGLSFLTILGLNVLDVDYASDIRAVYFDRSFVVPGVHTTVYSEFFSDHPYTYGSHYRGMNLLIDYPYDLPLNFLMGVYMSGDLDDSENSHLWSNGIATAGPCGIVITGFMLGGILWCLDAAAAGLNPRMVAAMVAGYAIPIINLSLPGTLAGCGLGTMILALSVMPRFEQNKPTLASRRDAARDPEVVGHSL